MDTDEILFLFLKTFINAMNIQLTKFQSLFITYMYVNMYYIFKICV